MMLLAITTDCIDTAARFCILAHLHKSPSQFPCSNDWRRAVLHIRSQAKKDELPLQLSNSLAGQGHLIALSKLDDLHCTHSLFQ